MRSKQTILKLTGFGLVALAVLLFVLSFELRTRPPPRSIHLVASLAQKNRSPPEDVAPKEGVDYYATYNISAIQPRPEYNIRPDSIYKFPNKSLPLNFFRMSWQPSIFYFPHFLTEEECDHMIDRAKNQMKRSEVVPYKDSGAANVQDVRTSLQTWLSASTPLHRTIEQRIELVMQSTNAETMQILQYGKGQKYSAHLDFFDPKMYGAQKTQRVATFFLYFSTVISGGETYFPRANGGPPVTNYDDCTVGLRVRPRRGGAVLFYDMRPDGYLDPYSLHGSCPVVEGMKWAGTKWFRQATPDGGGKMGV